MSLSAFLLLCLISAFVILFLFRGLEFESDEDAFDIGIYGFGFGFSRSEKTKALVHSASNGLFSGLFLTTPEWCPYGINVKDFR